MKNAPPLIVERATTRPVNGESCRDVIAFADLLHAVRSEGPIATAGRYGDIDLRTYRLATLPRRLATGLVLRWLSRGEVSITDEQGESLDVTPTALLAWGARAIAERLGQSGFVREQKRNLERLKSQLPRVRNAVRNAARNAINAKRGRPLYIRSDAWFGIVAGGSVAHISGVLNAMAELGPGPRFLTTDQVPLVSPDIATHVVQPPQYLRDFPRHYGLSCDRAVYEAGRRAIAEERPSFIYARHAIQSYAAGQLALEHNLPFILEFNGSEAWIEKHWGDQASASPLAEAIEAFHLQAADLIVVVSQALEDSLAALGISRDKILVNPNGVDTDRYHPDIDGTAIRQALGLDGKIVFGFVGTFGRWHGAEVLAEAFGELHRTHPEPDRLALVYVGDGEMREETERRIATQCEQQPSLQDRVHFVGRVPQAEAVHYLAASDVLVSPHVPNPDGSEFFGSPTKLFEYLALGKPVVASRLAQIGEVLEHDHTAWLTNPGDASSLAAGLRELIANPERAQRLGAAARRQAVDRHSWRSHVDQILASAAGG